MARDDVVDTNVRQKCKVLFAQWANAYKNVPGLQPIANLYKEFPKSQRPAAARQKVLSDSHAASEAEAGRSPFEEPAETRPRATSKPHPPVQASSSRPVTLTPTSSGISSKLFKDKKGSTGKFKLSHEKENMTNAIAQASIASTNLLNGLQLINRETERVSQNQECVRRFEVCRNLRRKILYYIQHVESDEWIGSLVNANDELVKALTAYEIMDRSIDDDSDSDAWENPDAARPSSPKVSSSTQQQLAVLSLEEAPPAKPPRPNAPAAVPMPPAAPPMPPAQNGSDDEEDEDDPFGDSHAAKTPYEERAGMTWREV